MDDAEVLADPGEYAAMLVHLLRAATSSVYFSSFTAHLHVPLPNQGGITLGALFDELAVRQVKLHILYNPEPAYGNLPPADFARRLPYAEVRAVQGSGMLPAAARLLVRNLRYSNHHQKYMCVDGRVFMLGGTDVTAERAAWLQSNKDGYLWHEVAVVVPCTPAIYSFVCSNFDAIVTHPPFPLTRGLHEYTLLCQLIGAAQTCVHMEAQTCISAGATSNQLLDCVAQRVKAAHSAVQGGCVDRFRFMLLTNKEQRDEAAVISWVVAQQLFWSRRYLFKQAQRLGVPREFVEARVFIGYMEWQGKHIKVHSNLFIQDGQRMLRSSSNFNDRSMSALPSDNELGIALRGEVVAEVQQRLWCRYLQLPRNTVLSPEQAFDMMSAGVGVVKPVTFHATHDGTYLPDAAVNPVLAALHTGPWFGGKRQIEWEVVPA